MMATRTLGQGCRFIRAPVERSQHPRARCRAAATTMLFSCAIQQSKPERLLLSVLRRVASLCPNGRQGKGADTMAHEEVKWVL